MFKNIIVTIALVLCSLSYAFAGGLPSPIQNKGGDKTNDKKKGVAESYTANVNAIEKAFSEATSVQEKVSLDVLSSNAVKKQTTVAADNKLVLAFVLTTIVPFVGAFGIHRVIMGGQALLILYYIITIFGIFGIIPFVDWICMIIDLIKGGNRFAGNNSFIAW